MSEEKQIAEMASDLEVISDGSGNIDFYRTAEIMYRKSYRKQSEWISIAERLPEKAGRYLVYGVIGGQPLVCGMYYNKYNGFDGEITHWMPLPEPPKGD